MGTACPRRLERGSKIRTLARPRYCTVAAIFARRAAFSSAFKACANNTYIRIHTGQGDRHAGMERSRAL